MSPATATSPRRDIYYWKCDRDATLHGVSRRSAGTSGESMASSLRDKLESWLGTGIEISPPLCRGDHITFMASAGGTKYFIRIDDGPEGDRQFETESLLMRSLRSLGVPVPEVLFHDVSRKDLAFSLQVLEYIPGHDLSHLQNVPEDEWLDIACEIGKNIARWQSLKFDTFGPLFPGTLGCGEQNRLQGFHSSYEDYFFIRLEKHIGHLRGEGFLSPLEADSLLSLFQTHKDLARLGKGCLVHKDLALWNIMKDREGIAAFIDWDDAISGDPTDDISLFACFHRGAALHRLIEGYREVRELPPDFQGRFWLHLTRNLIVKAVIRSQAGYFSPHSKAFMLPAGMDGPAFSTETRARLLQAAQGLSRNSPIYNP